MATNWQGEKNDKVTISLVNSETNFQPYRGDKRGG